MSIKQTHLAKHWGVSPGRVSQLRKDYHGGREFDFATLEQADAWRERNCPAQPQRAEIAARPRRTRGPRQPAMVKPTLPDLAAPNITSSSVSQSESSAPEDFDTEMMRNAENTARAAQRLYDEATACREHGQVTAALKNLNEANRHAANTRERFLALKQTARDLVPIDEVQSVIAPMLTELRRYLERQGQVMSQALAEKPADEIRRLLDAANDAHIGTLNAMASRMADELRTPPAVENSPAEEVAA